MTTTPDPRQIAAGLTKAANRALIRIDREWTAEGAPGPSRRDAYSLGWGRSGRLGLIERQCFGCGDYGVKWRYRLTPLGLAVRAILEGQSDG